MEDIRSMDLTDVVVFNSNGTEQDSSRDQKWGVIEVVEKEGDLLWATKVDRANGAKYDGNPLSRGGSKEDGKGSRTFFPKLKDSYHKGKEKRYGSMFAIQDRHLMENEKRKRVKLLRRAKKKNFNNDFFF
ncbi:hypothetical protein V6N13_047653 [Hibiscus sabdariffa]|uniref:Uncharacterized protein n=1 Tax=Hibiscus sabdariffa TaxID=183260 RepID=A0ABR2F4U4_9ROSI